MDLFEWSIPFVAEKVTEMFKHIIKPNQRVKASDEIPVELISKGDWIEKILKMQKEKTDENTELVNLNGRILDSSLIHDKEAREYTKKVHKKNFTKKKEIDLKNEKRPSEREGERKPWKSKK